MAAHTVGCGCIETVIAKETTRGIGGQHLPVEEHRNHICIFRAELHIVRYHHDGNALFFQLAQNGSQLFLEEAVDTFGRFIQQKKPGLGQQNLCQSGSLLLTSGEVIGMIIQ